MDALGLKRKSNPPIAKPGVTDLQDFEVSN
jgi:hypothetical protein